MDKDFILPFMISDHSANGRIVSLDATIQKITSLHNYPDKISELLAQLIVISCFLGQNLKKDGIITCQIQQGRGAVKLMVAEYMFGGHIRGYASFDEGGITEKTIFTDLVRDAILVVTVESGDEKYQGIINLDEENLTKAFTKYLLQSEQIDSILLISTSLKYIFDEKIIASRGIILKKMPKNDNISPDDNWNRYKHFINSVSEPELMETDEVELLSRLFHADGVLLFDKTKIEFKCRCSREKMENILKTIPDNEKEDLKIDGKISIKCQFCSHEENF